MRGGLSYRRGRNDIDGFVYSKDGQPKMIMTGNWAKSMSYQPCNADGEPVERAQLKEVGVSMSPASLCSPNFHLKLEEKCGP